MISRKPLIALSLLLIAAVGTLTAQEKSAKKSGRTDQKEQSNVKSETEGVEKETGKIKKIRRTEREWGKILTREQFRVLRRKGTEAPFRNKYDKHFQPGTYACAACGLELFASNTKFNSGCGWPAFYAAQAGDRVILKPDRSLNMVRTEVICARCDSHLGHVFRDAPMTPTGNRFCINSVSLKFIPAESRTKKTARQRAKGKRVKSRRQRRARR